MLSSSACLRPPIRCEALPPYHFEPPVPWGFVSSPPVRTVLPFLAFGIGQPRPAHNAVGFACGHLWGLGATLCSLRVVPKPTKSIRQSSSSDRSKRREIVHAIGHVSDLMRLKSNPREAFFSGFRRCFVSPVGRAPALRRRVRLLCGGRPSSAAAGLCLVALSGEGRR